VIEFIAVRDEKSAPLAVCLWAIVPRRRGLAFMLRWLEFSIEIKAVA
jgi:hypothetical protein